MSLHIHNHPKIHREDQAPKIHSEDQAPNYKWTFKNEYGTAESTLGPNGLSIEISTLHTYMKPMTIHDHEKLKKIRIRAMAPPIDPSRIVFLGGDEYTQFFEECYDKNFEDSCYQYCMKWALQNDPLSPFIVFDKNNKVIGYAGLVHPSIEKPNVLQLICMVENQNKANEVFSATEVCLALVHLFVIALIKNGHGIEGEEIFRIVSYVPEASSDERPEYEKKHYQALNMKNKIESKEATLDSGGTWTYFMDLPKNIQLDEPDSEALSKPAL